MGMEFEADPGYEFLAVSKNDQIQFQSKPFDSKKNCWIPDAEDGMSHSL
jgi:myosin protein heavy chain